MIYAVIPANERFTLISYEHMTIIQCGKTAINSCFLIIKNENQYFIGNNDTMTRNLEASSLMTLVLSVLMLIALLQEVPMKSLITKEDM